MHIYVGFTGQDDTNKTLTMASGNRKGWTKHKGKLFTLGFLGKRADIAWRNTHAGAKEEEESLSLHAIKPYPPPMGSKGWKVLFFDGKWAGRMGTVKKYARHEVHIAFTTLVEHPDQVRAQKEVIEKFSSEEAATIMTVISPDPPSAK